ncbi:MAG: RagB/SusD family nutrient uptake outer membrane protein [Parapedobacter sp.]|nr:MAG: RagB/SusD family nutrient uptake outer membrane protein [Parapedobacter sp.]
MKTKNTGYGAKLLALLLFAGCQDYLDLKPDKKMVVPHTAEDCRALLDDYDTMNTGYPNLGEGASDNLLLKDADWEALRNPEDRGLYTWESGTPPMVNQWSNPFRVVFNANLILKVLDELPGTADIRQMQGEALFFRAYAFHSLASHFIPPYQAATQGKAQGLPLRLTPEVDIAPGRGTVKETYDRIVADLERAVDLLPDKTPLPSRPNRVAALGMLARVYLAMGLYDEAGDFADRCLQLKPDLMDYSTLSATSTTPVSRFNSEVIFQSVASSGALFGTSVCRVDTMLYRSFEEDDLRKRVFFRINSDGYATFKGNYDGRFNSTQFTGLTTAEMYLTRAEANARSGKIDAAMDDLNTLLMSRWNKSAAFDEKNAWNTLSALKIILTERRKELVFRGLRWSDLRRLNTESAFQQLLVREIGGTTYRLPPGDPRYTFLIPNEVIARTNMEQNER